MKYPRYPAYRDSGVEWLGEFPAHWSAASLRWVSKRYAGGTPDKSNTAFWENGTIPWINSGAVNEPVILEPSTYITEDAYNKSSAKWIPKGALVIALAGQGKTKGMVAQLGFETTCNQSMAAVIPADRLDARFLFWWLSSNYQRIRNMAGGDLRDGLNLEMLGNIPCPITNLGEQEQIAGFLDRETAKIDTLIAKQERLIALLQEKRQALISHVVTKGLNHDVPMKESGDELLGRVPIHWQVRRLKHVLREPLMYGASESGEADRPEDPRFIRITDIDEAGSLREDTFRSLSPELAQPYLLSDGDVLFARSGATVGKAFIYRSALGKACFAGYLIRARLDTVTMEPQWLRFCSQTNFYWQYITAAQIQATIQNVSAEKYANLYLIIDPIN